MKYLLTFIIFFAFDNSFQFRLSPKQKVVGKDTSIMAEFRINKTVSSSNHCKASFSIDFKDGSKKVNTLKLIKL